MPPPLLLVHDDLATIASVRKALMRVGRTVQLATSISDALSAFDNLAPEAVLLAPAVEGGSGVRFLTELRARPAGAVTPVLLLGDPLPGFDLPVVRLPVDAPRLLEALEAALAPEAEDLPLLDAGHMEELPPLVDAALAQAEADLEAEAFAALRPPAPDLETWPPAEPAAPGAARAEETARAAEEEAERAPAEEATRREAEEARARAEAAERARGEAEKARARAEEALRTTQRAEAEERARRAEAEARARLEADEARRLEAEARAEVEQARAQAEAAQAAAQKAQAQGAAEAELLASALREEAARRTRELAAQERLRSEAEARAEREARARAEAEARAAAEVARLAGEAKAQKEAEQRARAEAEDRAAREREALSQAERAREQAHALEVEAAQLAERLAQGERAALEALARAEEALRRERAAAEALRGELAAARARPAPASPPVPEAPAPPPKRPAAPPAPARAPAARPPGPPAAPAAPRHPPPGPGSLPPAARLEWGAADGGRVTLEQLAALVLRLAQVRATARLELRAGETLRILWLSEGELSGAASTHPAESLTQQALSDGLLDEATAAEARTLRLPDEALAAELVERGALREGEVLPLLQRVAESRAVEALCERDTTYLLSTDATPPTEGGAPVRSLAALLAAALHRSLSAEELPARLADPRATPRPLRRDDLARFELPEREQRLLSAVDGERTVRELLARSGLRQEEGLLALSVAEVLGLVEVPASEVEPLPEPSADLELRRLDAKWASAVEADYFSVLGLPRTAGTEEVQRAHARLAREFDPLRYAGHSDPEVPARAARLHTLLDEAAQALSDDRLRAAYARSLVDAEGSSHAT